MARANPPEGEKKSALAAPKNVIPLLILGAVAIGGYAAAAVLYVSKQSAQDKANTLAGELNMLPGGYMAACKVNTAPCDAYNSDVSNVNDDATWGNVALGIGAAATVGAVVYWLVSDKPDSTSAKAVVTPMLGSSVGGVSVAGRF